MAGVQEACVDAVGQLHGLVVGDVRAKEILRVQGVVQRVQRRRRSLAAALGAHGTARLLFLQAGRVQHHHPRQLARGAGGQDAAAKALPHQQRNAPAMIEVGVGQQQHVDAGRIEAERFGIGLFQLGAALEHAAVDQHAVVVAGDQMTRTGDLLGRAVATVDEHAMHLRGPAHGMAAVCGVVHWPRLALSTGGEPLRQRVAIAGR